MSVFYLCSDHKDHRCTILHKNTKVVNSLNEVAAVIRENNNIRIALCLCIENLSKTIDEAKEKWGQRVLIVLCDKHYSSNFDPIHDGIVTRDIDLCSNGEWKWV
jgi:hypothetical protein